VEIIKRNKFRELVAKSWKKWLVSKSNVATIQQNNPPHHSLVKYMVTFTSFNRWWSL